MTVNNLPPALSLISEDKRIIGYRPNFARLTGSVTAAILLQQVFHWWVNSDSKPFYKFKTPCRAKQYREGDSWIEELAFTRHEFDGAIRVIGTKITKGDKKADLMAYQWPLLSDDLPLSEYKSLWRETIRHIVIYWTDSSRLTWYDVNINLLEKAVNEIYLGKATFRLYLEKAEKRIYLEDPKSGFSFKTKSTSKSTKDNGSLETKSEPLEQESPQDEKPKTMFQIVRDEVIDGCEFAETSKDDRTIYGRSGQITKFLIGESVKVGKASYTLACAEWSAKPGDFKRFVSWWKGKFSTADVPRNIGILKERFEEWRLEEARQNAIPSVSVPASQKAEQALYAGGEK